MVPGLTGGFVPLTNLDHKETIHLAPAAPYNFDANFHNPSHFPSSNNVWEQKIISRLIFNEKSVSIDRLLGFFRKFEGWEKLAFHYIWEDVFWKRKHEHIEWLEKEIRL